MSPSHGGQPRDRGGALDRFVEMCTADERIVASFLGGSRARGGDADEHSDIDLCMIVADDAYDDVVAGRETIVRRLGEPLFLEEFGNDHMAFAILTDGTELESHFFSQGDMHSIRSGPGSMPGGRPWPSSARSLDVDVGRLRSRQVSWLPGQRRFSEPSPGLWGTG